MQDPSFVLVIEDHPLYSQALAHLMRSRFPDRRIESGSTADEAISFLSECSAEVLAKSVLLLTASLPSFSGASLVGHINSLFPEIKLLVLSGSEDKWCVGACLGAGALAVLSKRCSPEQMVELVSRALTGQLSQPEWITAQGRMDPGELPKIRLTERQFEVLALICQGMSNQQIAEKLNIIEATTKAHVSAILKALGVTSRTQALIAAYRMGWHADFPMRSMHKRLI
ncbi:MAG: hypothetical protein RIQ97_1355 [Pseudomonadota bacterium]|jgi:DNA-binding NarL/FixJ family response regulator